MPHGGSKFESIESRGNSKHNFLFSSCGCKSFSCISLLPTRKFHPILSSNKFSINFHVNYVLFPRLLFFWCQSVRTWICWNGFKEFCFKVLQDRKRSQFRIFRVPRSHSLVFLLSIKPASDTPKHKTGVISKKWYV